MWRDRIQFADDDLGIAGMGRSIDSIDAAVKGSVRTRRDAEPKPNKCVARPGLTAAWTVVDDAEPGVLADPAAEARRAIVDYRKAWARISGGVS